VKKKEKKKKVKRGVQTWETCPPLKHQWNRRKNHKGKKGERRFFIASTPKKRRKQRNENNGEWNTRKKREQQCYPEDGQTGDVSVYHTQQQNKIC